MLGLYWLTLFVSAALLFLIQPMFAKMVLPLLGGVPAVWNTFVLFFQVSLLAGYAYAHGLATWVGIKRQALVHGILLLLPLCLLPIGVPQDWVPPVRTNPVPWLLELLAISVGLPFFIVSTSTPILQKWFASTGHPSAKDPYFLYAASNLGSLLALLGYPLLLEPFLRLSEQSWVWTYGYGLLVLLILACAVTVWRAPANAGMSSVPEGPAVNPSGAVTAEPATLGSWSGPLRWMALSFVPSSLMLGVTTFLTTDLPTVPLLWIIPLAIYLLSFVLVFAKKPLIPLGWMVRVLPLTILPLVTWMLLKADEPLWLAISLHLFTFFVLAMVCHGQLVASRPPSQGLTGFYMWMALGSVLGSSFNALIAPVIFKIPIEYPLAIVLGCLLGPRMIQEHRSRLNGWLDLALPLAFGFIFGAIIWIVESSSLKTGVLSVSLMFAMPLLVCFIFRKRPFRFGLAVGCLMLAPLLYQQYGRVLYKERSFFGIYRVIVDGAARFHLLTHGNINHGMQSLDPRQRYIPLTYYTRAGPIGQVFEAFSHARPKTRVAVVGLGTGSMACYGIPGQEFVFYEIDPAVERIAREPRFFTFLRDCPPRIAVVLGDARLTLNHEPDHRYGLIVLDAFTSESVPMHLLTREALGLYLHKLDPNGVLAFHISNQYLDLNPILGNLALEAGLVCFTRNHRLSGQTDGFGGRLASRWVAMARNRANLLGLAEDPRWARCEASRDDRVWTDDFSNILGAIQWIPR